jgi:hypothetical protein
LWANQEIRINMTKNMTRKGFAIGSGLALVASALISSPAAYAAGEVTLAPSAGTSYATILGDNFKLATSINSSNSTALKYKITNADAIELTINWDSTSQAASVGEDDISSPNEDTDIAIVSGTNGGFKSDDTSFVATPTVSAGNVYDYVSTLDITAAGTAAVSITVQAWIDQNNNGLVDDFYASEIRTVSFVKVADITTSIDLTSPLAGDTTAKATFSFTNVNTEQVELTKVGINFTQGDGTALAGSGVKFIDDGSTPALTFPSATKVFTATTGALTSLVKNTGSVKAQVVFKAATGPAVTDLIGASVTMTVGSVAAGSVTADVVDDTNGNLVSSGVGDVRNDGTFTVRAVLKNTASPAVVLAGAAVTAMVETSVAPTTAKTVTVGGTTYTSAATLPGATDVAKLAVGTTDADGAVSLTVSTAGFANTNTVTVTFYTENISDAVVATLKDVTYAGYIENINGLKVTTVDGTAASVQVVVLDQFGATAPAGYKATAVFSSGTGYVAQATAAATAASGAEVVLSSGRGTLTILDNGTGKGVNTYDIGFVSGVVGASATAIKADLQVHLLDSVNTVAGSFSLTDGSAALALNTAEDAYDMTAGQNGASNAKLAIQTVDSAAANVVFGNYDSRVLAGAAPNVNGSLTNPVATLAGVVTSTFSGSVSSAVLPNASVTISGAGMQFKASENSSDIWGKDSLTVQANASGAFSFSVYSQAAGVSTVTITTGSLSKSVDLYTADADDNAGTVMTVTAGEYVSAGSTVKVTIALVDRFGNPVPAIDTADASDSAADFKVTWSGPGLIVGGLPDALGADGTAELNVLLGSNDTGSIVVVASYDQDGDNNYTDATDIVVSKTLIIGSAPVVADTKVNVGSFKGFVALYAKGYEGQKMSAIVAGKWIVVESLASDFERVVRFTGAGYTITTKIYIDGVQVGDAFTTVTK